MEKTIVEKLEKNWKKMGSREEWRGRREKSRRETKRGYYIKILEPRTVENGLAKYFIIPALLNLVHRIFCGGQQFFKLESDAISSPSEYIHKVHSTSNILWFNYTVWADFFLYFITFCWGLRMNREYLRTVKIHCSTSRAKVLSDAGNGCSEDWTSTEVTTRSWA